MATMSIDDYFKLIEQRQLKGMSEKEFNEYDKTMRSRPHGAKPPKVYDKPITGFHEIVHGRIF